MQDKVEGDWFKPSKQNLNLKSTNPRTEIIGFSTELKTKCEKCTMECIQNEKSLNHSHKQTLLEI